MLKKVIDPTVRQDRLRQLARTFDNELDRICPLGTWKEDTGSFCWDAWTKLRITYDRLKGGCRDLYTHEGARKWEQWADRTIRSYSILVSNLQGATVLDVATLRPVLDSIQADNLMG